MEFKTGRSKNLEKDLHFLPCTIQASGRANVSKYFTPHITEDVDTGIKEGYFRGRGITGKEVGIPPGYEGIVFGTGRNEEGEEIYVEKGNFSKFTIWTWDRTPNFVHTEDAVERSLDYVELANIIHRDVDEAEDVQEENKGVSETENAKGSNGVETTEETEKE